MADSQVILRFIKSVKQKRLALHALYSLSGGIMTALSFYLADKALKKVIYFQIPFEETVYLIIFVLAVALFFLIGYKKNADTLKNAIYVDNRFSLKDRFSSYLDCMRHNVPEEIIEFQGRALTGDVIPQLKGKNIIDFKKHFSLKYIALCLSFIFLLSYLPDKKGEGGVLTGEEKVMLREQGKNLSEFAARLKKNKELAAVLSNEKFNEFSKLVEDSANKMKKRNLDKKEAMKLLSRLIDSSREMLRDARSELTATGDIAQFDTEKLNVDNKAQELINSKQEGLKKNIEDIKDEKKSAAEKKEAAEAAKGILDSISEIIKNNADSQAGEKLGSAADSRDITGDELKKLNEIIEAAKEEIKKSEYIAELEKSVKGMNDDLKKGKEKLSDAEGGGNGEGVEAGEKGKGKDIKLTFDSRIKNMKKGEAGVGQGPGTTNENVGYTSFDPAAPQKGKVVHDMTDVKFEKIYAASRLETGKEMLSVKGVLGEGDIAATSTTKALSAKVPLETPYSDVYGDYKMIAQKAITAQKVPKLYKDYVLDYFDSINPDQE